MILNYLVNFYWLPLKKKFYFCFLTILLTINILQEILYSFFVRFLRTLSAPSNLNCHSFFITNFTFRYFYKFQFLVAWNAQLISHLNRDETSFLHIVVRWIWLHRWKPRNFVYLDFFEESLMIVIWIMIWIIYFLRHYRFVWMNDVHVAFLRNIQYRSKETIQCVTYLYTDRIFDCPQFMNNQVFFAKKFTAHSFRLLLAPFASKLINYSRLSRPLNIRKNLKSATFSLCSTFFKGSLCLE